MVNFENGKTPINDVNLNKAQQDLKGTVLYSNDTGTTGNVTLSDSVANYDSIIIQCKRGDFIYSSGRIFSPNGKTVALSASYSEDATLYMYSKVITINGKVISVVRSKLSYFADNATPRFANDTSNYITEVIGYK